MSEPLLNQKVEISVIEPWELGDMVLHGHIEAVEEGRPEKWKSALVRLIEPFQHEKASHGYLDASPRHADANLGSLLKGEAVVCGATFTTLKQWETKPIPTSITNPSNGNARVGLLGIICGIKIVRAEYVSRRGV